MTRHTYSWNMDFREYEDGSGYEAKFYTCRICTLMTELGLKHLIPAMCRLDYTMSEAGGVTNFVREYTLASGGPYCDCGYKKINKISDKTPNFLELQTQNRCVIIKSCKNNKN